MKEKLIKSSVLLSFEAVPGLDMHQDPLTKSLVPIAVGLYFTAIDYRALKPSPVSRKSLLHSVQHSKKRLSQNIAVYFVNC